MSSRVGAAFVVESGVWLKMSESFQEMSSVQGADLERRIADVRELAHTETESYRVVKDEVTGEHYLHYRYIHRHVAEGGAEEAFHQLMPLSSDDVLELLFAGADYRYPSAWERPFLRNGPDGVYIWFDPRPAMEGDELEAEREAERLKQALAEFKRQGRYSAEDVERLFRKLEDDRK